MYIMTKIRILLLVLVISMAASGCGINDLEEAEVDEGNKAAISGKEDETDRYMIEDMGDSVSFVDGRGEKLQVEKNPERVIVLMNSFVDMWVENGGEMVGKVEDPNNQV